MKDAEPCRDFISKDPGAGAHYPDPCKKCGWSLPGHASYHTSKRLRELEAEVAQMKLAISAAFFAGYQRGRNTTR